MTIVVWSLVIAYVAVSVVVGWTTFMASVEDHGLAAAPVTAILAMLLWPILLPWMVIGALRSR